MTDRLVCLGSTSWDGEATVSYDCLRTVTAEHVGFMGAAGSWWFKYQANILCPNLEGWEDAPATAKCGELKNNLAADFMSGKWDISDKLCSGEVNKAGGNCLT